MQRLYVSIRAWVMLTTNVWTGVRLAKGSTGLIHETIHDIAIADIFTAAAPFLSSFTSATVKAIW